jgi:hypothetical protein
VMLVGVIACGRASLLDLGVCRARHAVPLLLGR